MDTNRPDYARAEEGRATSGERAGLYTRKARASGQQRYELMSLTTLAREIQSGSGL